MRRLRRHDLVWLRAGAVVDLTACSAAAAADVEAWRKAGRPLVSARSDGLSADRLRLGLTLPGTGERRRVSLTAARTDVERSTPPPPLDTLVDTLPAAHRPSLHAFAERCTALGIAPRVYGSLLWQSLSGEPCLRADSDLDLLFDLEGPAPLPSLLELLRDADGALRLDGEIRCGAHAVAWRELAAAFDGSGPRRVLAKSDDGIALIDVAALWPARSRAA
ncbi:MAG: malonate decarboxylase holo-[acyl-carrier-protein] synthase [Methyloversatilis discipulorum]|uniref:malonate decarboxylase holo-[acyl-carrier-protein] synthase n=1 Tax=Methyloversatilis discipulorum TaxID=1119528 RepID=UPI0026F1582B|nr:malonate decarboxylase holo-[acyl-carrier-protein] synthase [Methyloversatilis discipulorum]MBT9516320.1 malonate decarboxylase holo-[acyl-carrier-protein] synthase [Methyloversatilis discipulorum]